MASQTHVRALSVPAGRCARNGTSWALWLPCPLCWALSGCAKRLWGLCLQGLREESLPANVGSFMGLGRSCKSSACPPPCVVIALRKLLGLALSRQTRWDVVRGDNSFLSLQPATSFSVCPGSGPTARPRPRVMTCVFGRGDAGGASSEPEPESPVLFKGKCGTPCRGDRAAALLFQVLTLPLGSALRESTQQATLTATVARTPRAPLPNARRGRGSGPPAL